MNQYRLPVCGEYETRQDRRRIKKNVRMYFLLKIRQSGKSLISFVLNTDKAKPRQLLDMVPDLIDRFKKDKKMTEKEVSELLDEAEKEKK